MAFNAFRLRCAAVSLRLRAAAPNFPMSEESITKGMVLFFLRNVKNNRFLTCWPHFVLDNTQRRVG